MNIKKTLTVAGVTSGVALASMVGIAGAETSNSGSGQDSLVTKIAQKFNLSESEVKAVFDEERSSREAERQKDFEAKLSEAVTAGKLTEDQKAKIIAKMKELKTEREANRDAMKDKTADERKAAIEAKRAELEKWAADNDIPEEYLRLGGGKAGFGHGGGPGRGPNN